MTPKMAPKMAAKQPGFSYPSLGSFPGPGWILFWGPILGGGGGGGGPTVGFVWGLCRGDSMLGSFLWSIPFLGAVLGMDPIWGHFQLLVGSFFGVPFWGGRRGSHSWVCVGSL